MTIDTTPAAYVIRLHSCPSRGETYDTATYVEDGDPDYQPEGDARSAFMSGQVTPTTDIDRAKRFASSAKAFEWWRQPATIVPLRPDGKPNRPFTAYDVEIVRVLVFEPAERVS